MIKRRWWLGCALMVLTLALAVGFAFRADRTLESLSARWAPSPSQFIEVNGTLLHVRDVGPREGSLPLILLHGTSASLHTWEGWVSVLQGSRRVVSFDLPGFGLTGPRGNGDYRIQSYVEDVLALMDRLQIARAVIAGNSLGGEIAWNTAVRAPDRVAALVLVDSAGYAFVPKSIPVGFRLARNAWTAPLVRLITPRHVVAASVRSTFGNPDKVDEATIDRYFELTLRAGNRGALVARIEQMEYGENAADIARIRQPTLILWGGRDQLIPPENAARFHADIAGSELKVFDDLGHIPQEEDPARTLVPVLQFLASVH